MHQFLFRRKYRHINLHTVDPLSSLHKYFLLVLVVLKHNKTILLVGEVQNINIPDNIVNDIGYLNLEKANSVGMSGCNTYYKLKKIGDCDLYKGNSDDIDKKI